MKRPICQSNENFMVESGSFPETALLHFKRFKDERGWFQEAFNVNKLRTMDAYLDLHMPEAFVQENHSLSKKGVIRGLHWQPQMGKLMRVTRGRAYLVTLDIRVGSETFGMHSGMEVGADDGLAIWAPWKYARGFQALEDGTEVQYLCTDFHQPDVEHGINPLDPDINVEWPLRDHILSTKDQTAPYLRDYKEAYFTPRPRMSLPNNVLCGY